MSGGKGGPLTHPMRDLLYCVGATPVQTTPYLYRVLFSPGTNDSNTPICTGGRQVDTFEICMGVVAIFVYKVQLTRTTSELCQYYRPVRLAYQPPASSTFLSEQISHQQPASSTFLSEQISTSHQPPAKRTGCMFLNMLNNKNTMASCNCVLSNISVTRIRRSDC
jgi:hypothetical protein